MGLIKKTLATLALLLIAGRAYGEAPNTENDKKSQFYIAPYVWLKGISGTVGARGRSTEVDASFSDLRDHIESAGMIAVEALFQNKFGITANLSFANLGDQASHNGISLSGGTDLLVSDVALFYRVGSFPLNQTGSFMNLDILAGLRYWDVGLELNLDTPYLGSHRISRSRDWVDPFVGARAQFHLNDRWSFILQGGIGGGGDTSRTWDASARVGCRIGGNSTLLLGYRAVSVDRREGSGTDRFIFDTTLSGPLIGLVFVF